MRKNDIGRIVFGLFMSVCCVCLVLCPQRIFAEDISERIFSVSADPIRVYPPEDFAEPVTDSTDFSAALSDSQKGDDLSVTDESVGTDSATAESQVKTEEEQEPAGATIPDKAVTTEDVGPSRNFNTTANIQPVSGLTAAEKITPEESGSLKTQDITAEAQPVSGLTAAEKTTPEESGSLKTQDITAEAQPSSDLTASEEVVKDETATPNSLITTDEVKEALDSLAVDESGNVASELPDTPVSVEEYSTAELLRSLESETAVQDTPGEMREPLAQPASQTITSSSNRSRKTQPGEMVDIDSMDVEARIDEAFAKAHEIMLSQHSDEVVEKTVELPLAEGTSEQPDSLQMMEPTNEEVLTGLIKPELSDKRIDLDFDQVTLGEIFMSLGKICDINVVLDPQVKAIPSDLHLKQVLIREAFLLMGHSHNLAFRRVENSLFVISKDKMKEQSLTSKIFKLKNIRASEAKTMLAEVVKTINISEEINSIMVIGTREQIAKAENIIKTIDEAQPQVILEAKIVEINKDALKELGVDWSDTATLTLQEGGRPTEMPEIADPTVSPFRINGFERSPILLSQIIHALENDNKAKLLSNPRIMTLNNKEAEIFVGDRLPYTITSTSTGVATTEVRYEEPGIRLKITPSIIEGDFVVIKVEPEVSYIYSFRGPSNEYPWTKKRYALAYVRVKDGQAFVIGGLLNQEDKNNLYKVPMLGNLPLIGNLFSYNKHTVTDTELIIIITPTIMDPKKG